MNSTNLISARERYSKLLYDKMMIEIEIQETKEDILYHFLNDEINKYIPFDYTDVILEVLTTHYWFRFKVDDYFEEHTWHGPHEFNYGDFIFDQKHGQMCIVMDETNIFMTLWYFEEIKNDEPYIFRKRRKDSDDIEVITRMSYTGNAETND